MQCPDSGKHLINVNYCLKGKREKSSWPGTRRQAVPILTYPIIVYLCTTPCPDRLPYINLYITRHQAKSRSYILRCSGRTILLHYSVSFDSSPAIPWKHEFVFPFHVLPALWRQWTQSSFDKWMNEWKDGRSSVYLKYFHSRLLGSWIIFEWISLYKNCTESRVELK